MRKKIYEKTAIVFSTVIFALTAVCGCEIGKGQTEETRKPAETKREKETVCKIAVKESESTTEPESVCEYETIPDIETTVSTNPPMTEKKQEEQKPEPIVYAEPEITYISGIMIVNKTYALPSTYNPGVDPTAQAALNEMFAAALSNDGISLWVASGFRSYSTQNWLYNNYVRQDGQTAADRYSARPGHSEHQTGLAFDLNLVDDSFANTPAGQWLAAHCWEYGFIIRYPDGKEAQTGYKYEPWHVRYVGKEMAKAVFDSGLCLEEYLGITSVYT